MSRRCSLITTTAVTDLHDFVPTEHGKLRLTELTELAED